MTLYEGFRDPPREHSIRPFWFWNGELTAAEVGRQIDAMVAQGVYGAYVHCRSGLRPRYLSEEWWELVLAGVARARQVGFAFCVVDEYNWPSGDARDYTLPGYPSRVLDRDPGFRMRSLVPYLGEVEGAEYVVEQDGSVWSFRLEDAVSFDGGLVDLMNPDAVDAFVDVVYAEYARRLGADFGTTLVGTFVDHEGDYGYRLGWTPRLREEFRRRKGYDLVPELPLLLEDGGPRTPKVRCDYFDVVSDLYAEFFAKLSAFARPHGVDVTGHVWEESLHAAVAFQGDHFRVQRALATPGVDSLFEWGRLPRHFLEARSVAHFRGLGLVVENQGVQGADSYLSPERAKRVTNTIAVWGATTLVPHALNGAPDRIDFPEDWFERQPWWPFFHHYADYARRLSFMNSGGRHVCDVALYYPIESVWAHGDPCFSAGKWDYIFEGADDLNGPRVTWGNPADEVDRVYGEILETLPARQRDLDVVDAHYLTEAEIRDCALAIGGESFRALVLPPMTCMRLSSARRVHAFRDAGGVVVAVGRLPVDSMENGRGDPELARELADVECVPDVDALLAFLDQRLPRDLEVMEGPREHLRFLHRVKDGRDVYWIVNDSGDGQRYRLRLAAAGPAEVWDPDGGGRYSYDGTLQLGPWHGLYVVFGGDEAPARAEGRVAGELRLEGPWRLALEAGETPLPYSVDGAWLSPERFTLRDWWVVGPFDYRHHLGWSDEHPPERELDLDAEYDGKFGRVRWVRHESPGRVVDLDAPLGHGLARWGGMQFKTAYALARVESPRELDCELRVTADSNAKAWLNGELVLAERDDHQGYLELRDAYGLRRQVRLRAGENTLLLKVSQGVRYGGVFGFVARLCDRDGQPVLEPPPPEPRLRLPAGTTGVTLGGEYPVARVAEVPCELGSLAKTPLAFYAGPLRYECDFELPEGWEDARVALDVGEVGVAAAVSVNNRAAGERAWRPFRFDVTGLLRAGRNAIHVVVANTRANERARGADEVALWDVPVRGPRLLDRIDLDGLHGPVRLLRLE